MGNMFKLACLKIFPRQYVHVRVDAPFNFSFTSFTWMGEESLQLKRISDVCWLFPVVVEMWTPGICWQLVSFTEDIVMRARLTFCTRFLCVCGSIPCTLDITIVCTGLRLTSVCRTGYTSEVPPLREQTICKISRLPSKSMKHASRSCLLCAFQKQHVEPESC